MCTAVVLVYSCGCRPGLRVIRVLVACVVVSVVSRALWLVGGRTVSATFDRHS